MIKFYDVDEDYVKFLQTIDGKIPNIKYSSSNNDKFVCGVVLTINGHNYYAPISHFATKQRTTLQIIDNNRPIATIRFSFMFPALDSVLSKKDFSAIRKSDAKYADLLNAEYQFCKSNYDNIIKKALSVYNIGCNKNHVLNYNCCDFKKLEENYMNFKKN